MRQLGTDWLGRKGGSGYGGRTNAEHRATDRRRARPGGLRCRGDGHGSISGSVSRRREGGRVARYRIGGDEIRALGRKATAVVSDVSDDRSVDALVQQVINEHGRIDFVVNNAGAARGEDRRPIVDVEPDVWRRVIDVNLNGSFLMSRAFARKMIEQGEGGGIVNISSIAGKMLPPENAAYAASKAGLHALTACMSGEVGKDNIRVNAICPGIIDTSRLDDMRGEMWDRVVQDYIPLGRAGTGEEIAYMTVFLCSDQGAWVTGQIYNVDGGQVAGR